MSPYSKAPEILQMLSPRELGGDNKTHTHTQSLFLTLSHTHNLLPDCGFRDLHANRWKEGVVAFGWEGLYFAYLTPPILFLLFPFLSSDARGASVQM